jgi:hypothetical protein
VFISCLSEEMRLQIICQARREYANLQQTFLAKITISNKLQPGVLIHSILVVYSMLPDCVTNGHPLIQALVTTLHIATTPI